jgi:CubicO group peptidase (beta-lactamase class C family)
MNKNPRHKSTKRKSGILKKFPLWLVYLVPVLVLILYGIPRYDKNQGLKPAQTATAGYNSSSLYSEEEIEFIDFQITKMLIDRGFNGNVLISRYGMLIYERSFGFSSFSRAEPMNIETTFQLASISKTFTAAAIMMLQREGRLKIDDPVKQYIPEFPYANVTIRHLLSHTSGLHNYMWLAERQWKKKEYPTNEDILKMFTAAQRGLNFTPGTRFEYSNTGYVFLGLLIERVSGLSFADFIHTRIFDPLGMNRSYVYDLHQPKNIDNRAFGYRFSRGRHLVIPDDILDGPLGDKGVFSTVRDLYKWDQALYRNELLSPEEWQMAFTHARLSNDTLVEYGLGWRLQNFLGKQIVHHPGRWHGFRTSFKRFPQDRTTIVVLSNNDQSVLEVIEAIQDILYYDDKEIWLAAKNTPARVEIEAETLEPGVVN